MVREQEGKRQETTREKRAGGGGKEQQGGDILDIYIYIDNANKFINLILSYDNGYDEFGNT